MTLPFERRHAVSWARRFLLQLSTPGMHRVETAVRQEARSILRHFPTDFSMSDVEEAFGPEEEHEHKD